MLVLLILPFFRPTTNPGSERPTRAFNGIRFSRALRENLGMQLSKLDFKQLKSVQIGAIPLKESLKARQNKLIDGFSIKEFITTNYEPLRAKITEIAMEAAKRYHEFFLRAFFKRLTHWPVFTLAHF